ncbi:MAG: hypothetical protein H6Q33_4119 [Deltaproteobacteria bacterium]|jgi:Zn-finger nucleic acid-binding protein|nr:hypothetical protein [Deltaproteobacteria bacterium]
MREVRAEAITGYLIVLDQCPHCGGLWCDRWELYPVTAAAAKRLDGVDQPALQRSIQVPKRSLECPRCRARLSRFHDPTLPADARIERCPNCDGMWFNRGELRRFKERRMPGAGGAPAPAGTPVGDTQVAELANRTLGAPPALPTVRALDDFDMPRPIAADTRGLREELKANAGWLITRALLRLLLHV